jgi:hypothetical protein
MADGAHHDQSESDCAETFSSHSTKETCTSGRTPSNFHGSPDHSPVELEALYPILTNYTLLHIRLYRPKVINYMIIFRGTKSAPR